MKTMIEQILANKWPVHTIFYCRFQGNPPAHQELMTPSMTSGSATDSPKRSIASTRFFII